MRATMQPGGNFQHCSKPGRASHDQPLPPIILYTGQDLRQAWCGVTEGLLICVRGQFSYFHPIEQIDLTMQ